MSEPQPLKIFSSSENSQHLERQRSLHFIVKAFNISNYLFTKAVWFFDNYFEVSILLTSCQVIIFTNSDVILVGKYCRSSRPSISSHGDEIHR